MTLALVWVERYGAARVAAAVAVAALVVGWALAQDPYLLPGELTLERGAAADAVLAAVLISMGVGALILRRRCGGSIASRCRGGWTRATSRSTSASGHEMAGRHAGVLAVGLVLMIGFEHAITRVFGLLALFAFIVIGVFLIADPAFLAAEDEDD